MVINNRLISDSFQYKDGALTMIEREEEIYNLSDIYVHCQNFEKKETFDFDDDIWDVEVEEGVSLADWLYCSFNDESTEYKRMVMEFLTKKNQAEDADFELQISLGPYDSAINTLDQYIKQRRKILTKVANVHQFGELVGSCFTKCIFSADMKSGLNTVENFDRNVDEIVKNLAVLNDEAISLYREYQNDLSKAMAILSSKLLECSPDPNHKKDLIFDFKYTEESNGKIETRIKQIECQPHLKLIRRDSNLRIYFYWCDSTVGNGEKVLIGRIGSHPYS